MKMYELKLTENEMFLMILAAGVMERMIEEPDIWPMNDLDVDQALGDLRDITSKIENLIPRFKVPGGMAALLKKKPPTLTSV